MDPSGRSWTGPTGSPRSVDTGTPFEHVRPFAAFTPASKQPLVPDYSWIFSLPTTVFASFNDPSARKKEQHP